ncbi:hypothetical protein [Bradyrhizobium sp. Tv2a-2]|uniref:hypothetical protein n=1 Tax=Bradyrhizobium sp. Tv2a-2 TaxID=113395 RepID=UPI00040BEAFD|nr:hypothetical protein [Bradyrhizobium sp. Tv2a-2]
MAITSGAGPHKAWLNVDGETLAIENGSVTQSAKRKTSSFSCAIPMSVKGAYETLAGLGDNNATITVLTRGTTGTLITGEVDRVSIDYIGRTIRVTGRDGSAKLHDNKSSEKWLNKMPSDIVSDLIGRVGLSGNVTSSALMAGKKVSSDFVKLSDNVSFAYIIHKLAQLDNAKWWVDPSGKFHYVPIGSPAGTYSIFINQDQEPIVSDCLDLNITRNVQAGKGISATVKSWHPKLKQTFQYQSNVEGRGGPVQYQYHIPNLTQDHATKYAQSMASEKARHELTVSATVVGDPTVYAGMGLKLSGTKLFDQTYDIDTVHHNFGMPGHRTHITARGAGEGRSAS